MGHHDTGEFLLFQTNAQLLAKTATNTIARKNFQKFQLENAVFLNKKTNKKLAESTQKRMIREAFKELKKDEIQMFEGKMTVDWNKFVMPEKVEKSKSEKVKNSESKISSPTSEEPVRV